MAADVDEAPADGAAPAEPPVRRRLAPILVGVTAVLMAALLYVLVTGGGDEGESATTPLMGRPAPAATGTLDDGGTFDLSRRRGSWVVLNFFTHNCVPCEREHPELVRFVDQQRQLGDQGAEFYTIVQHSTRDQVEEFFDEHGGDWPIVYDDDFEFQNDFGVAQVPETWVIDPNGFVRARIITEVEADWLSGLIQQIREQTA